MAHHLAATRRLRKGLLPGTTPDARPASDAPPPRSVTPTIGERVVADVRHEIGNHFHKLYYWADFLAESRNGRGSDLTATQMLEETIRDLETLLRATLEYVRPMSAAPILMPLREVVDGIVRQLTVGLGERAVTASVEAVPAAEATVLIDPGRLSQLLGILGRRIDALTDGGHGLVLRTTLEPGGEALTVEIAGTSSGASHSTLTEVEWAIAENVARLVGGELTVCDAGGHVTFALTLSLRS